MNLEGRSVLIIDDDPEFRTSVMSVLEAGGMKVHAEPDGKSGLVAAARLRPDYILCDVMMETADTGLEVLTALRDNPETAQIPVFLITGIKKPQFLLGSFAPETAYPNVRGMFEKPVDPRELIKRLEAIEGE